MNSIYLFFQTHMGFTIFCCWIIAAACSSLRAPTAQSSQGYVTLFAIANLIGANLSRILPPKVEDSPNFQAALQKAIADSKNVPKLS